MTSLRNCRYFHTTSCFYLRKIAAQKKISAEIPTKTTQVAGTFHHFPEKVSYKNFYGVEGDEGVINVEDSANAKESNKTFIAKLASNVSREKLANVKFGNIRWDKDNKLMYHGQFDSDYGQDDLFKRNYESTTVDNFFDETELTSDVINEMNKQEDTSMSGQEAPSKQELGFLDELFLNNVESEYLKRKLEPEYENIKKNSCKESEASSTESSSFIDNLYFNETDCINKQNISLVQSNSKEEVYMNETLKDNKSEFINSKENTVSESSNFHPTNQCIKQKSEDINYFDNEYFSNQNNISNSKFNVPSKFEELHSSKKQDQDSVPSNEYRSSTNSELSKKNNFSYSYRTELEELNTELSHETNPTELLKAVQNANVSKQHEKSKISSKKDESETGFADDVKTAEDFVTKFRKEKLPPRHMIKNGIIKPAGEVKYDSKGFKILKNQVTSLKYFTRDEILQLLKSNVLYSDDDMIVLNKPYNLVMHESQTTKEVCLSSYLDDLAKELDDKNPAPKLFTVHRLDKETTGCLIIARNEMSAQKLKLLFSQRQIIKTYWIVTINVPDPLEGIIDIPIAEGMVDKKTRMVLNPNLPKDIAYKSFSKHGKNAVTNYSVVAQSGNAALVEVKPETGLKHQIRVHFGLGLACPILGDHKYSHLTKMVPQKLPSDLLQRLHVRQSKVRHIPMHIYARSILIPNYKDGRNLFVMAPMPIHMSKNLQQLKFKKK